MRKLLFPGAALAAGALLAGAASSPHPPGSRLAALAPLFETSDRCLACHAGVTAPDGEDVSIGFDWRPTMMANSARDPYWHAAVRREVMDFPEEAAAIENECAACHMPMARTVANLDGRSGGVFAHLAGEADPEETALAMDGVSCSLCHQIRPDNLGREDSFTGGFLVDPDTPPGERQVFGPFEVDAGRLRIMHSATGFRPTAADHLSRSELCATCHVLHTHALGEGAGVRFPEQASYAEWRASAFWPDRTCQSCHMPEVAGEVPVTSVLGVPRDAVSTHRFLGGNFFMLRMLNRYRDELGVAALPQELETAALRTLDFLRNETARVDVESAELDDGRLVADVLVTNLTGHKFPTDYPSRRAWLHVAVRDAGGATVFESGAFDPDGSVRGNDHDADPMRFEPHHRVVEHPEQVQVYEVVMAGPSGRPTTGLLTATQYLKDNRLLPAGWDPDRANPDVAIRGGAAEDPDFTAGGDRVRYVADVRASQGPFTIDVQLWFQPISFRWARNLADYDAPETRRFLAWYEAMAPASAVVVARARAEAGG